MIDFHVHIFPPEIVNQRDKYFLDEPDFRLIYSVPGSRLATREDVLNMMDENGISRAVVFGFPWRVDDNFKRNNDYIIETVQLHPDRFTGFATFSILNHNVTVELERCINEGLSGMGELALYSDDENFLNHMDELMEMALDKDLPVLIHTNEPVGHEYPGKVKMGLSDIYGFLRRFPQNRIVLAHWGGGLFFYSMMKREVTETLKNVYFDTSASPFLYRHDIWRMAGEIVGFDKILFGSDFPLLSPSRYLKEMKSAGLSHDQIKRITRVNAEKVLGLIS